MGGTKSSALAPCCDNARAEFRLPCSRAVECFAIHACEQRIAQRTDRGDSYGVQPLVSLDERVVLGHFNNLGPLWLTAAETQKHRPLVPEADRAVHIGAYLLHLPCRRGVIENHQLDP